MLVVEGSNFVHGDEFLPIFQILILPKYYYTQLSCHVPKKVERNLALANLKLKK